MIPFFDYRPEYLRLAGALEAAVRRVLESGRLILGPEVEAFEREFARYHDCAAGVGVATGTDAIALALRALDVGRGDEVITVANAGVPPVAAIRLAGATPVFVDVDAATLSIDPAAVAAAIGERTRAILAVHLYGNPADAAALAALADKHGIALVEDCAQAHGATLDGRAVGSFGALSCFSFYPTKNLGAFGDGGMVLGRDAASLARVRKLRMYGYGDARKVSELEGGNSRLDELHAAMLRVKLATLAETNAERRRHAARYRDCFADALFPQALPRAEPVHHLCVARVEDRDRRREELRARGVETAVHYAPPVYRMPAYERFAPAAGALPATEEACRTVLSLPLYPGLPEEVFERVAGERGAGAR